MKAAVYTRYSSSNQRPASLADQERRCRQAASERGWEVVQVYRDSEISGVVARARPGYQAMMAAAKAAEFDVLVVDELSRLARNPEELASLRNRFRFWGVDLVALGDGLDTVAAPGSAAAIMAIKGVVNESELEANAFRSWRGLEGRVLAGQHAGGAPFGYRTRPVHADKPGDPPGTGQVIGYEYLIHESEAETIRRIFQLYAQGSSPRRIAALLNAEGVPAPAARWRNRNGSRMTWSASAICGNPKKGCGLLNQVKYAGKVCWNRSTWPRDPERDGKQVRRELPRDKWVVRELPEIRIVPQKVWDAVKARQQQMSTTNGGTVSHKRHQRLLSGFLTCANCGATLVLRGANTYGCASRHNRGAAVCDTRVTVNVAEAETTVLQVLQEVLFSEDLLADVTATVRRHLAEAAREKPRGQGRQTSLRARLAEVEATIGRLTEAIAQGLLVEDLRRKAAEAQAKRELLREELALQERATVPAYWLDDVPAIVRAYVSDLRTLLDAGQVERVKAGLAALVKGIEVHEVPRPGARRPGARLVLRGNLAGAIALANGKVKTGGSPGGIRTRDLLAENQIS